MDVLGRERCGSEAGSKETWWYNQGTVRSPVFSEGWGRRKMESWSSSQHQDVKASGSY